MWYPEHRLARWNVEFPKKEVDCFCPVNVRGSYKEQIQGEISPILCFAVVQAILDLNALVMHPVSLMNRIVLEIFSVQKGQGREHQGFELMCKSLLWYWQNPPGKTGLLDCMMKVCCPQDGEPFSFPQSSVFTRQLFFIMDLALIKAFIFFSLWIQSSGSHYFCSQID